MPAELALGQIEGFFVLIFQTLFCKILVQGFQGFARDVLENQEWVHDPVAGWLLGPIVVIWSIVRLYGKGSARRLGEEPGQWLPEAESGWAFGLAA